MHHWWHQKNTKAIVQQIKLGKRCVLRPGCYAIPPVSMGDNVTLCTNTIVNPGDKLNDDAVAQGEPSQSFAACVQGQH